MSAVPAPIEAIGFVRKALGHYRPPEGAGILDVGCGEGEFARALAAEGFDVTGIDASPEKIASALEFEQDRLHFYTHDIRLPFHINYFDYALSLFSRFGGYRTNREHSNAIRSIAHAIKHGGFLFLDYDNRGNEGAQLTLGNFNELFAYHGLQMQQVYGNYNFDVYDVKKSPRLIMIAKKQ